MTDYSSGGNGSNGGGAAGIVFTTLLALGTLIVIVCLFLPFIDSAKINALNAPIRAREAKERRLENENNREESGLRVEDFKGDFKKLDEARMAKRKERDESRKKWETERKALDEKVEAAELSARQTVLWYRWGMMIGYLIMAAGAIGYLSPSQSTARRIAGAIFLAGPLSMIFFAYVVQSFMSYNDYR